MAVTMTNQKMSEFLKSSQIEQVQATIWFQGNRITGVVVQIEDDLVEMRHESGRSVILLSRIDAITIE